jgi:hypothetical protein
MSRFFAHATDDLRRNLRLLVRHARHGRASFGARESVGKTAGLTAVYRGVNAHLRGLGVDYALAYGTLLGWHRSGGILPHDRDVDFAAPATAFPAIWNSRGKLPPGFTMHDTSHRHGGPKLYVSHGGWEADIYFYAETKGQLLPFVHSTDPGDSVPFPREYFFPPRPATFLGEATFVPAQPVALLEHLYRYIGPNAERDPVTRYFRPRQV